ncbi:glycosyltransferase family 2 protein [Chromobacterium rhizoryzae]|uniref:glycosyltransferase family 2 protein n=1 Tax=Chromobacterium rhizoryzae TaxID=1778675 RepID=UPI001D065C80|nr:glycosyltransferase family 2 protein [Chromobacterium rhizoryzae]
MLHFIWHFNKNHFVKALSSLPSTQNWALTNCKLWAFYQLGAYLTVSQAVSHKLGWRGVFAKTVSLAACGQMAMARQMLKRFRQQACWRQHDIALADALLPFLPEEALSLLKNSPAPPSTLLAAALLRNGKTMEAQHLLRNQSQHSLQQEPELYLLLTNADGGTPLDQLHRLNAFLAAYEVPRLWLLDTSQPPSILNVTVLHASTSVIGPLVSVLMTTFRTGTRALAAIESVLAQSYRNLELIVVDDASDDQTPDLLTAIAKRDTRVQVIRLPKNVGTYIAKRIGLERAKGEFVTCHDSDDWMHPERIARQVTPLLADSRLICTTSNWVRIQDDGVFYARPVHPLMRLNPASPLFRRERVLYATGPWDCVRTGADSEFLARLRVVFGTKAIKKIRQPLTLGCHRPNSLMTASDTGYSDTAISPQRLAYWEAWSNWHLEMLSRKQVPRINADIITALQQRPFSAPSKILVEPNDALQSLSTLRSQ